MRDDDVRQGRSWPLPGRGVRGTDTSFVHVQLVRNLPHDKTVFLKYGCIINATVEVVMSWILDGRV